MSSTAIFWAIYVVGYFICFFNESSHIGADEIERVPSLAVLVLLWPIWAAVCVPCRIWQWHADRQWLVEWKRSLRANKTLEG